MDSMQESILLMSCDVVGVDVANFSVMGILRYYIFMC